MVVSTYFTATNEELSLLCRKAVEATGIEVQEPFMLSVYRRGEHPEGEHIAIFMGAYRGRTVNILITHAYMNGAPCYHVLHSPMQVGRPWSVKYRTSRDWIKSVPSIKVLCEFTQEEYLGDL